ncbi:unnamed protein product [Clonostachys rosea]|uniref:Heme haloperoxidase family profile domain-containing protein n=1 Tax=Bionectria ochroleuca TaxID=29856 RepID=A0ABY6UZC5_BIOOC|nr:unnamed protein product [Clonostachys rosea]
MTSVVAAFKANHLRPAYNMLQPYIDKETLRQIFGITIAGLSLTSGEVTGGRAAVLEPIPHDQMEKWLTQTGSKTVDSDVANFVHNPDYRLNQNYKEADAFFDILGYYLSDNLLGTFRPNILRDFTRWEMFPHKNTFLQELSHNDWYVHGILRYCKEKRPPVLGPRVPYNTSFVSDRNPLKDGVLSKSELVAILGLAFVYASGAIARDDLPFIIPVTIVSASWRSARVVQGVVDLTAKPKPSVDIRMSRIVSFEKGVKTPEA